MATAECCGCIGERESNSAGDHSKMRKPGASFPAYRETHVSFVYVMEKAEDQPWS